MMGMEHLKVFRANVRAWELEIDPWVYFFFFPLFLSFLSGGTTSSLGSRFAVDNPIDFVARTSRLASNLLFSLSICFSLLSSDAALILLLLTFRIWSITKWKRFSQLLPFSPFRLHLSVDSPPWKRACKEKSRSLFFVCDLVGKRNGSSRNWQHEMWKKVESCA